MAHCIRIPDNIDWLKSLKARQDHISSSSFNFNMLSKNAPTQVSPVVLVHHTGPDIDVSLEGEARPGGDPSVGAPRNFDLGEDRKKHVTGCFWTQVEMSTH